VSWKIVGIIESRGGDLEVLPDWTIGAPNDFQSLQHATLVRDSMQSVVDHQRAPRGAADAPKLPPVKYMILPAIDGNLIDQLQGNAPPPTQQQHAPSLSFGGAPT
jgi:hypothetical protein